MSKKLILVFLLPILIAVGMAGYRYWFVPPGDGCVEWEARWYVKHRITGQKKYFETCDIPRIWKVTDAAPMFTNN